MIGKYVLKIHPLTLTYLGLLNEDSTINQQHFARLMWRIGEMCEEKWWETNNIVHPRRKGMIVFGLMLPDLLTGRKIVFGAVPGDRPYIYLWTTEKAETRNVDQMVAILPSAGNPSNGESTKRTSHSR